MGKKVGERNMVISPKEIGSPHRFNFPILGQMDGATGGGEAPSSAGGGSQPAVPAPAPAPIPNANAPPPFLSKTYDMVDDSATDEIVSWSPTNNSFVVWNPPEFARDLLPKYFKHSNFSSFVRQLNTYGFRKVDPDRWEFANEGFLRGQKHLLKSINRRKPAHGHSQQQPQPSHGQNTVGACVEVGKFGLEEEIERLKRDKNVLMQELVRLRQQQQSTDNQLQTMVQRLQGMEQRQQQMMSFLAKAVQSPGFLAQFVQQQNESSRRISEANKKRRLRQEVVAESNLSAASDGQIVKYQPPMNESAKAMLRQMVKVEPSSGMDTFNNSTDCFLISDRSSSSSSAAVDSRSSSCRVSGVTLREVLPTSGQTSSVPVSSGVTAPAVSESSPQSLTSEKVTTAQFPDISMLVGSQNAPSLPISQGDVVMPELSQMPEMVPEDNFLSNETGGFLDPESLGLDGSMSINLDDIAPDPDIDALLESTTFWDDLLLQSPMAEELSPEGTTKDIDEVQPKENGWNKTQNMDNLTEKMGLLTSDGKEV
ncbi:heat shock factor protein HSF8 [Cannabis sativa]|uniref:heat shock factor protein HSF8 n=1 Tax=Cannabis sativa TaxID=3483 RepID=UPI0011E014A1|nr:heat shock factor protein HSF8 [Cannabis sativa]